MDREQKVRVPVLAGGDEGRFLEWDGSRWRAFNTYKYGHLFEKSELTAHDFSVLRDYFKFERVGPNDDELIKLPPEDV